MLRIESICEGDGTRIRLCGELRAAHLEAVRAEIARLAPPVTLDLEEIILVDIEVVRWLNDCLAQGIQVENHAPYIREWMSQEKSGDEKQR
jgi:hypothetical protein